VRKVEKVGRVRKIERKILPDSSYLPHLPHLPHLPYSAPDEGQH
jgi:hypothetical protein